MSLYGNRGESHYSRKERIKILSLDVESSDRAPGDEVTSFNVGESHPERISPARQR